MTQSTRCDFCSGRALETYECPLCGVGCCSSACAAAHHAAAHAQSGATPPLLPQVEAATDRAGRSESLAGLRPGMQVRLPTGAGGVVVECYAESGTVRVRYIAGQSRAEGLFRLAELTTDDTLPPG